MPITVIFYKCQILVQMFAICTVRGPPIWSSLHPAFSVLWCNIHQQKRFGDRSLSDRNYEQSDATTHMKNRILIYHMSDTPHSLNSSTGQFTIILSYSILLQWWHKISQCCFYNNFKIMYLLYILLLYVHDSRQLAMFL